MDRQVADQHESIYETARKDICSEIIPRNGKGLGEFPKALVQELCVHVRQGDAC